MCKKMWTRMIVLLLGFCSLAFSTTLTTQEVLALMREHFKCITVRPRTRSADLDSSMELAATEEPDERREKQGPTKDRFLFGLSDFHAQVSNQTYEILSKVFYAHYSQYFLVQCLWGAVAKKVKYVEMAENLEAAATAWSAEYFDQEHRDHINITTIHFLGVGLGAHFFALAMRPVQVDRGVRVARITGLDPTGICFHEKSASKCGGKTFPGLKKTDAIFVDVLFTGREFWGFCDPPSMADAMDMCHACFFANGGYRQPGCAGNGDGPNLLGACSHNRAAELYLESVGAPGSFNSSGCRTGDIGLGPCDVIFNNFGHSADKDSEGIFGFATNAYPPYSIPLICWPEAGSDDGKSTFTDCHISDHSIV